MERVAVFVIDGHDINVYADAERAAAEIEGYDAKTFEYIGADGTVFEATVEGPDWGSVTLHRTDGNRLEELVTVLLDEAKTRSLPLPADTPRDPEATWRALLMAQREQREKRRR
jgi:hypothetical protein